MPHSHQTIKLSKGRHSSPDQGACVMELASMLAGEKFSDHPQSVSRPIAAFLRGYNDMVDDDRRQDLYAYASKVVGTVAPRLLEAKRAERLVQWANELRAQRRLALLARIKSRDGRRIRARDVDSSGRYAVQAIRRINDDVHASVLRLVDELIAMGEHPVQAPVVVREPAGVRF